VTTPAPDAGQRGNRTLEQITLISRVLEGDEPAPRAIIEDYTISGEPGNETATLTYSIPLARNAVTYAQQKAAMAKPLYDGTLWKITLQTCKAARAAETMRASRDDEHTQELPRLQGEIGRLRAERDAARARLAELGHNE
jgi:hypothetical protein